MDTKVIGQGYNLEAKLAFISWLELTQEFFGQYRVRMR